MIFSYLNLLYIHFLNKPINLLLILILILNLKLILNVYYINIKYKYKIYNFISNWLYISIYISYYIILVLVLRYLSWGSYINLKIIFTKIQKLWFDSPLLFINSICFFILFLLITHKIRSFLIKELQKRHIYYYTYYQDPFNEQYNNNTLTYYISKYYSRKVSHIEVFGFSYNRQITTPLARVIHKIRDFFVGPHSIKEDPYNTIIIPYWIKNAIELIPFFILLALFIYDVYFNNFIINKIFYYLPFYIIITFWRNLTNFYVYTDRLWNIFFYELYYMKEDLLFWFDNEIEKKETYKYLNRYLYKGLQSIGVEQMFINGYWVTLWEQEREWLALVIKKHMYKRDSTVTDVYKFIKNIDVYEQLSKINWEDDTSIFDENMYNIQNYIIIFTKEEYKEILSRQDE